MSAPDSTPSLLEFAASLTPPTTCRVCELAELAEINAARKAGVSYVKIARWLVAVRGYVPGYVSNHRIQAHFNNKHDV